MQAVKPKGGLIGQMGGMAKMIPDLKFDPQDMCYDAEKNKMTVRCIVTGKGP